MKQNQLTEMLEKKRITYDFMNLLWRFPFSILISSSDYIRVDLEESELNYIELKGKEKSAYIIVQNHYPLNCYFYLIRRWTELNACPVFPLLEMKLSEDFSYSLYCRMFANEKKEFIDRMHIPFDDLSRFFGNIELTDIILHDKSSVKLHPKYSDERVFKRKYGHLSKDFFDENNNRGFFMGSFQYDYSSRLGCDFNRYDMKSSIGVIEARMTENPYQLRVLLNDYVRKLKARDIICDPYYVIRFADGKPHTYDSIVSVSCIVCIGTPKIKGNQSSDAFLLTEEQLRDETQKLAGLFPCSNWFVSDDPEKAIEEIQAHPLMNPAPKCLFIC